MIRWSTEIRSQYRRDPSIVRSNRTSPILLLARDADLKYAVVRLSPGCEMYNNILTMCWSIKEVNKNLSDRDTMTDYSVGYLKKACSDLSTILTSGGANLEEVIEVVDRTGETKRFTLREVAKMLSDAKKIIEFNLIDHVDQWARNRSEDTS